MVTDAGPAVRDRDRLLALRRLVLLDTPPDPAFDRITAMAARLLRAPTALLTLVDADRLWFKSAFGIPQALTSQRETTLDYSVCQYAVAAGAPLVLRDARTRSGLRAHPMVRELGVRAYAGVPVFTPDEHAAGTLCVLDARPRHWTDDELANLQDLAAIATREIALHVHTRREAHRHLWRGAQPLLARVAG